MISNGNGTQALYQEENQALQVEIARLRKQLTEMERLLTYQQLEINELERDSQRFRAIFDQTFQFIALLTADGIVLEANRSALEFGGFSRDDAVGNLFWEAHWWTISRETQQRLQVAIQEASRGNFQRYEVEVWGGQYQIITIDFSLNPVYDEHGTVAFLIAEGRDITQQVAQKRALQASEAALAQARAELEQRVEERTAELHQSQSVLQAVLDNLPAPVHVRNRGYQFVLTNKYYNQATRLSAEQIIGQADYELFPPETVAEWRAQDQHIIVTGTAMQFEDTFEREYGTYHYLTIKFPVFDTQGELILLGGISIDITEQKRAQEEVYVFKTLIEKATDGFVIGSAEGTITYTNPAYRRMYAYDDDMFGLSVMGYNQFGRPSTNTDNAVNNHDAWILARVYPESPQGW